MKDDIETLPERLVRTELKDVTGSLLGSAADEICRLRAERDLLQGRVGALQKALDDRYAEDKKAVKAIFRATGRTRGVPPNVEIVAFYVAEVERLRTENAALRTIISKCADALGNGAAISHDCSIAFMGELPSEIGLHVASLTDDRDTWKERSDSLRAKLERAKEVLEWYGENARLCRLIHSGGDKGRNALSDDGGNRARAVLSDLSADAPAQQTQRDVITRDKDIILQALAEYDAWMLDDDYDATTALHKIMKRMRDRALVEPAQQTQGSDEAAQSEP
jgi:hypothetical protein